MFHNVFLHWLILVRFYILNKGTILTYIYKAYTLVHTFFIKDLG